MRTIASSVGSIDPELLRARLNAVGDPSWRERVATLVEGSLSCLGKFQAVDFGVLEREAATKPARDLWADVEASLAQMWLAVEDLQQSLRPLVEAHSAGTEGSDAMPADVLGDENALSLSVPEPPAVSAGAALDGQQKAEARVRETAWAMAFVLRNELDSFRRRLPALLKLSDGWELVGAVQDHIGHMHSAVNAIATGIFASLPGGETGKQSGQIHDLELFTSRELRSRVFELRAHVLSLEATMQAQPAGTWHELLLRLRKLVDAFMFGAAFAWMRAGDKRSFLEHQRTLSELLALWSPLRAEPARRAVANFARYLEVLELINNRECLKNHDRRALGVVVETLSEVVAHPGSVESRTTLGKGLAALAEAQGRDRELDALLVQTLDPSRPVPTEAILARAKEVLSRL